MTRRTIYFLLCIVGVIFLFLRLRWVGHLLSWDEAMALCTVRAFKAGGYDHFSNWFWRHPPLFSILMLLLKPFDIGFAERTELLVVFSAFVSAIFLFLLNRKIYGDETALWSVFFVAAMPGAVFYDTWIKGDYLVSLFGFVSIYCFVNKKPFYSGLLLGLAFLSKETAVFFALALFLLWLTNGEYKRDFLYLIIMPLVISGWWYALPFFQNGEGSGLSGIFEHINFAFKKDSGYVEPWYYYFSHLPSILGFASTFFLVACLAFLAFRFIYQLFSKGSTVSYMVILRAQKEIFWPFFLIAPSLLLLMFLPSKVPWIIISLLPAIATVCAIIATQALNLFQNIIVAKMPPEMGERLFYLTISAIVIFLLMGILCCPYERWMEVMVPDQYRGASYSREIAETMNKMIKENERVFLTSFHYWKGLPPGHGCPVFAYYFTNKVEVIIRPYTYPFDKVIEDIKKYKLDWAMLSPEPGEDERAILDGFVRNLRIEPVVVLQKAFIFRTTSLYK